MMIMKLLLSIVYLLHSLNRRFKVIHQ